VSSDAFSANPRTANFSRLPRESDSLRLLHLVVGSGISEYFLNAVRSVQDLTDDYVLAIYNYVDETDRLKVTPHLENLQGSRSTVLLRPNENSSAVKTGSLYAAYNEAVKFAGTRFDYVNILQADMQLMHWDADTERNIDSIFKKAEANGSSQVVCVSTAFECRGKWTGEYFSENIVRDETLDSLIYVGVPMADVGIFSLKKIREFGIVFGGHETDMQEQLANLGFVMPKLDAPVAAFVPWPATVRKGKLIAQERLTRQDNLPILCLRGGYPSATSATNMWMEDWVFPNGWKTLYPYWLTDTSTHKWLHRRKEALRESGLGFWSTIDEYGLVADSRSLPRDSTPDSTKLLIEIVAYFFRDVGHKLVSSLKYRVKSFLTRSYD